MPEPKSLEMSLRLTPELWSKIDSEYRQRVQRGENISRSAIARERLADSYLIHYEL